MNQETGDLFTDRKNHFAAGANKATFPLFDGDLGIARATEEVLDFCVHDDCSRDTFALAQPQATAGGSLIGCGEMPALVPLLVVSTPASSGERGLQEMLAFDP